MDVRCSRCGTEYELDDTLVSSRGTMVRCTECDHQFQVKPESGARADHWVVRTAAGSQLEYDTLQTLQAAVSDRRVGPDDLLSRAGGPWRPFGSIAEFESLFQGTGHAPAPSGPRTLSGLSAPRPRSTSHGLGGPAPEQREASTTSAEPTVPQPGARRPPPPSSIPAAADSPRIEDTVHQNEPATTIKPAASIPAQVQPAAPSPGPVDPAAVAPPKPAVVAQPPAKPMAASPVAAPIEQATARPAPAPIATPERTGVSQARPRRKGEGLGRAFRNDETFDSLPMDLGTAPAAQPAARPQIAAPIESEPAHFDASAFDSSEIPGLPKRGRYGRWLAAVLVLGVPAAAAVVAGPEQLESLWTRARAAVDPGRVDRLVADGNALLRAGDLESAKESFVQATALDPASTSAKLGLAAIEAIRADHLWLQARLVEGDAVATVTRQFEMQLVKAKKKVAELPPRRDADLATTRLRVDLLRIGGELTEASELSNDLQGDRDSDSTYALAALDASEATPNWSVVADSLKAPAEQHHRRAHALRIYALVNAESLDAAKSELAALQKADQLNPVMPFLTAFVSKRVPVSDKPADDAAAKVASAAATARPADEAAVTKVAVKSPPSPGAKPRTASRPSAGSSPKSSKPRRSGKGDFRTWLQDGNDALGNGDLARAGEMFGRVLEVQPGNIEAMAGLGDVARLRNQPSRAASHYDAVLRRNPNYIPALMARADQKWSEGDRKGAAEMYQRVVSQVGDGGGYGRRAASRIAQMKSSGEVAPRPAAPPKAAPPKPAAAPEPDTADLPEHAPDDGAHIDTSDLPDFD